MGPARADASVMTQDIDSVGGRMIQYGGSCSVGGRMIQNGNPKSFLDLEAPFV